MVVTWEVCYIEISRSPARSHSFRVTGTGGANTDRDATTDPLLQDRGRRQTRLCHGRNRSPVGEGRELVEPRRVRLADADLASAVRAACAEPKARAVRRARVRALRLERRRFHARCVGPGPRDRRRRSRPRALPAPRHLARRTDRHRLRDPPPGAREPPHPVRLLRQRVQQPEAQCCPAQGVANPGRPRSSRLGTRDAGVPPGFLGAVSPRRVARVPARVRSAATRIRVAGERRQNDGRVRGPRRPRRRAPARQYPRS